MGITLNLNERKDLTPEKLELFKKQRIERRFADCDWWDLNDYLLLLLPSILEVFLHESYAHRFPVLTIWKKISRHSAQKGKTC